MPFIARALAATAAIAALAVPATGQDIDTEAGPEGTPLRLEELITEAGEVQLDLSLVVSARHDDEVRSLFETVPIGGGQFLTLPTAISSLQTETDTALVVGTLRYGVTDRLEVSARAVLAGSDLRFVENGVQAGRDRSATFNELGVGASWQFSDDDATPALIGFADVTLAEATDGDGGDYAYGRRLNAGLTMYRVIDPVVLTLTGGYRFAAERDLGTQNVDPGDILYLNPGVAFVANDAVTLTAGVNLQRLYADRLDGRRVGTDRTRADMEFGLGYGVSDALTLRAAARADVVGRDGFSAVMSLSYKFGK